MAGEVPVPEIAGAPRTMLGHWPTPLEPLERLSAALGGAEVWVKRDDCSGLAFGGNKVRKLEYLLAEARSAGCRGVVTVGGLQSNHARQTAAAAARLGLACDLVLVRLVPGRPPSDERTGNALLDRLLGARAHVVDGAGAAAARVAELLERAAAEGRPAAFIPPGGSTTTGALGYVRAGLEVAAQAEAAGLAFDRVVLAASTAGTLAGLVLGLARAGVRWPVAGVAVADEPETTRTAARQLVEETAARLGTDPSEAAPFEILGGYRGQAYGVATPGMREAVETCARLEGLLLDPVYTGKAMAALFDLVRRGELGRGRRALFWHTGGAPALFAYGDAFR